MPVPHSVRAKVSEERDLREAEERHRRDTEEVMRAKGSGDNRGRGMPRPHPHAGEHPAAHKCVTIHGVSQGGK